MEKKQELQYMCQQKNEFDEMIIYTRTDATIVVVTLDFQ